MVTQNEAGADSYRRPGQQQAEDIGAYGRGVLMGRAEEIALLNRILAAKDDEIAFLRKRLETLEGTLVEVASPGAHARVHFRPPERPPAEPKALAGRSPRDLARTRPDLSQATPEELEKMRQTPIPASVAAVIAATPTE